MRKKLTLEQFMVLKGEILDRLQKLNAASDATATDLYDQTILDFYENFYKNKLAHILSFDLSEISFESWANLPIIAMNGDTLDFEGTNANLDFAILEIDETKNYNFKTCKIKNLSRVNFTIDPASFDSTTINANSKLFLDDTFPQEFKDKFYSKRVTFEDYALLPTAQQKKLDKVLFVSRLTTSDRSFVFSILDIPSGTFSLLPEECTRIFDFANLLGSRFEEAKNIYNYLSTSIYFSNSGQLLTKLEFTTSEKFFESLYAASKELLENSRRNPNADDAPKELVERFPREFFLDVPEEIRKKIYSRKLTIDEYFANCEILKNRVKPYSFFDFSASFNLASILNTLSIEELDYMLTKHKNFLKYIIENDQRALFDLGNTIGQNLNEKIMYTLKSDFDPQNFVAMAVFMRDFALNSIEDLQTKTSSLPDIVSNFFIDIIDRLGIANLRTFDEETNGALSKDGLYNLVILGNYAMMEECKWTSYEEFKSLITKCIIKIAKSKLPFEYDLFKKSLINAQNSIFLSDEEEKIFESCGIDPKKFYDGILTLEDIIAHPTLIPVLKTKDLSFLLNRKSTYDIPLITSLGNERFFEVLDLYGPMTEKIFNSIIYLKDDASRENLEAEIADAFYTQIKEGRIEDYSSLPLTFRRAFPHLFLDKPDANLRAKFENRTLTAQDFSDHPEYFDYFKYTDLFAGLDTSFAVFIGKIKPPYTRMQNENKIKIARAFSKISSKDYHTRANFISYCVRNIDAIEESKLQDVTTIIARLTYTNSAKLMRVKDEICDMVLKSSTPMAAFDVIENIYLTNNLPDVAKTFAVFRILHSNEDGTLSLNLSQASSPVLNAHSKRSNEIIIYSDLLKSAIDSNNLSLRNYIRTLERGEVLLRKVDLGDFANLSPEDRRKLIDYSKHLIALYNQTSLGKTTPFSSTGNVAKDLFILQDLFGNVENINDHIVRMFMHFIGIDDVATLKSRMDERVRYRDAHSRKLELEEFTLYRGDMIKGLGQDSLNYLFPTMQNGALSTEFLGSSASNRGDSTPLDTELSVIGNPSFNMSATLNATISSTYGPVWLVIKSTSPFVYISRGLGCKESSKYLKAQLEAFETLNGGHYGIRTGFGSTNVDFIIAEQYSPHMGLAIAMQGFYIPIVDRQGKLLFTSAMFDEYRKQMEGLSYYGLEEYHLSDTLVTEETSSIVEALAENKTTTDAKNERIKEIIRTAVSTIDTGGETMHFEVTDSMDGNLEPGVLELIDIGSTGRHTNEIGAGDFDYIIRIDNDIMKSPSKLSAIKTAIMNAFGQKDLLFRYKKVHIPGIGTPVDIDISFVQKTDSINYSTDAAIKDKLHTIAHLAKEKYDYVLANIIFAKKVLKSAGCYYKTGHSKCVFGGLGGVGVENWILSHHGSFIEAAESFLTVAERYPDFEEFKNHYKVWDFGENFYYKRTSSTDDAESKYDEFVSSNMTMSGFEEMQKVLKQTLDKIHRIDVSKEELATTQKIQ